MQIGFGVMLAGVAIAFWIERGEILLYIEHPLMLIRPCEVIKAPCRAIRVGKHAVEHIDA
jgi:hypothetical protein